MNDLTRRTLLLASLPVSYWLRRGAACPPPEKPGTLVLAGGGKPGNEEVFDAFWKLAGAADAKLVVVPTAHEHMDSPETAPQRIELVSAPWRKRGVKSITLRHTLKREEADAETFLAPLKEATGIWFGGGDQRRLLQTYRDTRFHAELIAFLKRGGVVGGSSAGTAVQSELTLLTNAQGELSLEKGFNLLPGTVLDQHFLARGREERLQKVIEQHPTLIGVGVDEFTALVIREGEWSVVGKSSVTIYRATGSNQPLATTVLKAAPMPAKN